MAAVHPNLTNYINTHQGTYKPSEQVIGFTTNAGTVNPLRNAWGSTTVRSYINIARDADTGEVTFNKNSKGKKDPASVGINVSLNELQAKYELISEQQNNSEGRILAMQQMSLNHTYDMIQNFSAIDTDVDGNLQSNEIVTWLQQGEALQVENKKEKTAVTQVEAKESSDINLKNISLVDLLNLLSNATQMDMDGNGVITEQELTGFSTSGSIPKPEAPNQETPAKKEKGFFNKIGSFFKGLFK